ncbi:transposase [Bdellovibrio bacteriovorus]|uniref:transposase n=1 Tax=Bdellovibrio bacteriovorus TaxID=959 RepID=UPI0035A62021
MAKHFALQGNISHDFFETSFGGDLSKGKRKSRRPLSEKEPIHLVLKSNKAFGRRSLLHPVNRKLLLKYTRRFVFRFRVKLYRFANVGNHIHILIRVPDRQAYVSFISALTGTISKMIFKSAGMWDLRPFTRVASWGRGFSTLKRYIDRNVEQGLLVVEITMKRDRSWKRAGFDDVIWELPYAGRGSPMRRGGTMSMRV